MHLNLKNPKRLTSILKIQKAIKAYEKLVKMDVNKQVKINRSPQLKP